MKRFMGVKKKKEPAPTLDETGENMTKRGDAIEQKISKINRQLADVKAKMKRTKGSSKNVYKRKAMTLLKQRKMYENQLGTLQAQQFNIDQSKFAQESLQDNIKMVTAMKETQKQLKKDFKKINIDDVENLQDDMEDMMDEMNEMNEALARDYGMNSDVDSDDLLDELDALDDELDFDDDEDIDYLADKGDEKVETKEEEYDEFGLPKVKPKEQLQIN